MSAEAKVPTIDKKISMGTRLKKFVAAKVAENQKGRDVVKQKLGSNGEALLQLVLDFAASVKGDDYATQLNEFICKVVVKIAVLYDGNVLTNDDFVPLSLPIIKLASSAIDMAELSMIYYDPAKIAKYCNNVSKLLQDILKPHITGETNERIAFVSDFLPTAKFSTHCSKAPSTKTHASNLPI
eukprot:GABV01002068.1.p1 GENE.GABV01002068.1~~GABV01002068.1.p1  ORF type:complete len:191 (-),score=62.76 GABV01002068.1:175-723(-)